MKETLLTKFKSRVFRQRKSQRENVNCLPSKLSVNEEYLGAFRTKSYIEMSEIVQKHLEITESEPSSSSSLSRKTHLPRQETLRSMPETFNLHHLLVEYFEASEEAYKLCEILLRGVNETRIYYCGIRRVMKLSKFNPTYGELASFSVLENPLSIISPSKFREIHDGYMLLLQKLALKGRKLRRKLKFKKILKRVGGISLVISNAVLLIVLLLFAFHSLVGVVAVPGLVACFLGSIKTKKKVQTSSVERLRDQLDYASKGIYIMINDFNTVSRMVMRLKDEVDHWKSMADMCVKNGKYELLKEFVKEFHVHDSGLLDQLQELEQHIYLCYLTVNRSRVLVLQATTRHNNQES